MQIDTRWALRVFLTGVAMGAANIVPGVSGGTVAFISGIYERLINAIRSFGPAALRLLLAGRYGDFSRRTDLVFLGLLVAGVLLSILSLARLLQWLLDRHAVLVWAFFFGLILASIPFVAGKVRRWTPGPVACFLAGAGVAVGIALLSPAAENASVAYLMLCGVVAMASMIMPGLSGSFVLVLMGNYQLVMIDAVAGLSTLDPDAFRILVPVGIGAIMGLVTLSHLLAWIFRRFHDVAVALLSGFVAGSLLVIWPWKEPVLATFGSGAGTRVRVTGYEWLLPSSGGEALLAVAVMVGGCLLVLLLERLAGVRRLGAGPTSLV